MPKFKPYDHNQNAMVAINYQDQLVPGTFEILHGLYRTILSSTITTNIL
jgi:hypothetical protein